LLVQLLHGNSRFGGNGAGRDSSGCAQLGVMRASRASRARASIALHNIVHANPDAKRSQREARVLDWLARVRAYCDKLRDDDKDVEEDEVELVNSTTVQGDLDYLVSSSHLSHDFSL